MKNLIIIIISIASWIMVTNFLVDHFFNRANYEIVQVLVAILIVVYTAIGLKLIANLILRNL